MATVAEILEQLHQARVVIADQQEPSADKRRSGEG
jgi:hypothetical protein